MRPIPSDQVGYYFLNADGSYYDDYEELLTQENLIEHIGPALYKNENKKLIQVNAWNAVSSKQFILDCIVHVLHIVGDNTEIIEYLQKLLLTYSARSVTVEETHRIEAIALDLNNKAIEDMMASDPYAQQRVAYGRQAMFQAQSNIAHAVVTAARSQRASGYRLVLKYCQLANGLYTSSEYVGTMTVSQHSPEIAQAIANYKDAGVASEREWQSQELISRCQ